MIYWKFINNYKFIFEIILDYVSYPLNILTCIITIFYEYQNTLTNIIKIG